MRNRDREGDDRYDFETEEGMRRRGRREVCLCTDESTEGCPIHDPLYHERRRERRADRQSTKAQEVHDRANNFVWLEGVLDYAQRAVQAKPEIQDCVLSTFVPGRTGAVPIPLSRGQMLGILGLLEQMTTENRRAANEELLAMCREARGEV